MKTWERWTFNLLSLGVATTGFAYCWMKYVLQSQDPFALVNHPWQATMLHLHLIASPPFVLVFGMILNSHIMKKLGAKGVPSRGSGLTSLGTFAAMVVSGYLLQVVSNDVWLRSLVVLHIASGTTFALVYSTHLLVTVRLARARARTPVGELA